MNSMTPVMFMVMLCVMYMWYLYFVSCVVYVWRMYGVLRVVYGLGVLFSFRVFPFSFFLFFFSSFLLFFLSFFLFLFLFSFFPFLFFFFYSGLHLSVGISGVGNIGTEFGSGSCTGTWTAFGVEGIWQWMG